MTTFCVTASSSWNPTSSSVMADQDKNGIEMRDQANGGNVNAGFDDGEKKKVADPNGIDIEAAPLPSKADEARKHSKADQMWKKSDEITDEMEEFYNEHKKLIWTAIYLLLLIGYIIYFIYACWYDFQEALVLVILTAIVVFCVIVSKLTTKFDKPLDTNIYTPVQSKWNDNWHIIKWPFYVLLIILVVVVVVVFAKDNPNQLISAAGLILLVFLTYCGSHSPRHVKWRPVFWGMALQLFLGIIILRTKVGFEVFDFLGNLVNTFLDFTDAGSRFVFGDLFLNHYFAFKVLPIVIYFSSFVSLLYYVGVMQFVILRIAKVMQLTMGTSAGESLNAAGNIFIGQTEAPLLIRPYLYKMTKSELHAIMTGGFATIAGGVFGAFVSFGISPSHLLTASVMSAPAALAMAKLFYPEQEVSQVQTGEQMKLPKGEERNFIEAASNGASTAVSLALNIAANLIAFLGLLALLNALLGYFGGLVGIEGLSFELICSYVFMPIAFMMGTDWEDCREVAELIGIKTFVNEFVAYIRLADMIDNGTISKRSEVIATYACCGFANIGSIGIQLGGLGPLAPERKGDLARVAIRALIAGTVACFMTACIAGILYIPPEDMIASTMMPVNLTTVSATEIATEIVTEAATVIVTTVL